jgi:predicted PurR-regulated permease PerM
MYSVERYRKVGFGILCGLIAALCAAVLLPFWHALAWGIALAIIVYPLHRRLRAKLSPTAAAALTTLLTLSFVVLPICACALAAAGEVNAVASSLRNSAGEAGVLNQLSQSASKFLEGFGIENFDLKAAIQSALRPAVEAVPEYLNKAVHGFLTFIFSLLLLFFLLRDGDRLRQPALDLIPLPPDQSQRVLDSIYDTVHATFYGVVLIAILNGIMMSVLFWVLGIPSPLLWGIATIGVSFIPIAGAPVIYLPWAAYLANTGQVLQGIVLLLVGLLVISLGVDKIYRSILIGHRSNLHEMAVLFSLVGGVFAFGAVGTFVGPVVLIVSLAAVSVIRAVAESANAEEDARVLA